MVGFVPWTYTTMNMFQFMLAICLAVVSVSADKRCHGIYFTEKYYNIHFIKEGVNRIDNLILNRNDDVLYFTFEDLAPVPNRLVGYLNMDTKVAKIIEGIVNATSIAIDQKYNKVYVGSLNGLYKINDMKQAERLPIQDDIRNLHYKDVLYYVNSNGEAYVFEDGFGELVAELRGNKVDKMIVDNDNNIFFVNNSTLYRIKLGTRAVNIHEKINVGIITTDVRARAYVCAKNGVFVYNKYKFALDKVADMANLKGLTFNRANEPIYAVNDLILKLSESPIPCFED